MSKIAYALPAFAGQLTAKDRKQDSAISWKALRRGVTHTAFDVEEIIDSADRKLFTRITQPGHCLNYHLPPKTSAYRSHSLRKRQHFHQLPHIEFYSAKTVLSIDVCLDSDDWLVFISSLFFVSPCVITVAWYVFNVFFLIFCVHVTVCICHTALKGYLTIWLEKLWKIKIYKFCGLYWVDVHVRE